ncbi:RNA polymerase sigma factor [Chitinivorax sp. B]|uniref:RNA polymerase sigma factor n=1 Tax=Chitinivorax sp. B TaxID=2502235 RepID=UPI0010F9475A|nr:RNA polymerase sigma factor [Chitinivorax sp. B]
MNTPVNPTDTTILNLEVLAKQHGRRLYHFLRKHVGNHDAEDLMQSTYVEALRCADHFQGESKPETWLFGIAMNLVRHHLARSPEKRYEFVDEGVQEEHLISTVDPAQNVEEWQLVNRTVHALEQLPDDMRETLLLVVEEELPYEQAAAQLQIPIGTVRSRISRARTQLKQAVYA